MKAKYTEEEALKEYYKLLNEDSNFYMQWNVPYSNEAGMFYSDEHINKMNENNFYEWCSLYDDTKHIIKGDQ
nr:hypothetical protein [uncultured Mediterranean phage uvMED]BAR28430.1 hypothetical protein [uncultured Mediterranean phage uvMED]BAR28538.1 hypothetical protein [uncultured Mediterranean phage uvMED]